MEYLSLWIKIMIVYLEYNYLNNIPLKFLKTTSGEYLNKKNQLSYSNKFNMLQKYGLAR